MKLNIATAVLGLVVLFMVACQSDEQLEFRRYYAAGSVIYQNNCQNCHAAKGEGLQGLIPPLNDSVYLKSNRNILACIVKNGLKGKVTIKDRDFEGEMPSETISNIEIAEVITYVTNSFSNKLGGYNNDQAEVDLKNCK